MEDMRLLTTDIWEGAYLWSQGMTPERIWIDDQSLRHQVVFEFVGDKTELLSKDYQRGNACANVVRLKNALNELKDRMFNLIRTDPARQAYGARKEKRYEYQFTTK